MRRNRPLRRRTPLRSRPVDKQRRRFVADQLARRPNCEARFVIVSLPEDHELHDEMERAIRYHSCLVRAGELHEPLTRARGGSIYDAGNSVAICRPCHRWVHDHPKLAALPELGLLRSASHLDGA